MTRTVRSTGTGDDRRRSIAKISLTSIVGLLSMILMLAARQNQAPVFRAGASLVTVDAYPQQNGRIIEGLTPQDFEVFEDGKLQKVETFNFVRVEPAGTDTARRDPNTVDDASAAAADPRNRMFVAYLDRLHVAAEAAYFTRQPLLETLTRVLAPNDLFGVMTPKMRPRDLTLVRTLQAIEAQLTQYWSGARFAPVDDMRAVQDPEEALLASCFKNGWLVNTAVPDGAVMRPLSAVLLDRAHEAQTLTSLADLVAYLGSLREGRTTLLLFTNGWLLYGPDTALTAFAKPDVPQPLTLLRDPQRQAVGPAECSAELNRLAMLDDKPRFRELIVQANRRNVTFYPINPGLEVFDQVVPVAGATPNPNARPDQTSLNQDMRQVRDRIETVRTLAENTDGLAVVNTNDVAGGLKKVADDVSAFYLLGYYSTNAKMDGGFRRIQVKLKRPGLTIKARRGYMAPTAAENRAKAAAAAAASTGPSPVDEALGALARLQPSAEIFTYGVLAPGDLGIVAEIASSLIESGKWNPGADVQATVMGPTGAVIGTATGKIEPTTRGTLMHVPLPAGATGP